MKTIKKLHKVYAVWDYELEVEEMDLQSEQGWQLVEGKLFSRRYEKDDSKVYRYQLDYNNNEDVKYYEMFKEQGWEYINSTINGWNYFRKEVKEEFEEDDYVIYTDVDSKKQMNRRFLKIMSIVFFAVMLSNITHVFHFFEAPKIMSSGVIFVFLIYGFFFTKSLIGLNQTAKGIRPERRTKIELYFLLLIVAVIFMVNGMNSSYTTQYGFKGNEAGTAQEIKYEVTFPDMYYVYVESEEEISLSIEIIDENGDLVYQNKSFGKTNEQAGLFLRRGRYKCIIDGENTGDFIIGWK